MVYGPGGASVRPRPRWSAATVSADSVNGCTNSAAEASVAPDAFRKSKGRPSPLRSKYVSIPLSWAVGTGGRYPSPIEEPRRLFSRRVARDLERARLPPGVSSRECDPRHGSGRIRGVTPSHGRGMTTNDSSVSYDPFDVDIKPSRLPGSPRRRHALCVGRHRGGRDEDGLAVGEHGLGEGLAVGGVTDGRRLAAGHQRDRQHAEEHDHERGDEHRRAGRRRTRSARCPVSRPGSGPPPAVRAARRP